MRLLLIAILLLSCANFKMTYKAAIKTNYIEKEDRLYVVDFTEFTEREFLFTPEKYGGDYKSIGLIDNSFFEELILFKKGTKEKVELSNIRNEIFEDADDFNRKYDWHNPPISTQLILRSVYNNCIKMGADAFVNLESSNVQKVITFGSYAQYVTLGGKTKPDPISINPLTITINGLRITGFAIKRK